MAEIFPFRGLRYNQEQIPDISQALCPPYDVISPQQQQMLLQKSPYNMIHLEYGKELPEDSPAENKYSRAGKMLEEWLNKGLLQPEKNPAIKTIMAIVIIKNSMNVSRNFPRICVTPLHRHSRR